MLEKRYYRFPDKKTPRETVLMLASPCCWGKCSFCFFVEENSKDVLKQTKINDSTLSEVKGDLGCLEVCHSASWMELPSVTIQQVYQLAITHKISTIMSESHWWWRDYFRLSMQPFYDKGIKFMMKVGIESWDKYVREKIFNKYLGEVTPKTVKNYTDAICLLIGVKGQTKDSILQDIDMSLGVFKYIFVNCFDPQGRKEYMEMQDKNILNWAHNKLSFLHNTTGVEFTEALDF